MKIFDTKRKAHTLGSKSSSDDGRHPVKEMYFPLSPTKVQCQGEVPQKQIKDRVPKSLFLSDWFINPQFDQNKLVMQSGLRVYINSKGGRTNNSSSKESSHPRHGARRSGRNWMVRQKTFNQSHGKLDKHPWNSHQQTAHAPKAPWSKVRFGELGAAVLSAWRPISHGGERIPSPHSNNEKQSPHSEVNRLKAAWIGNSPLP